ncbi:tRNA (adenosine(37)-N6)-threonylcarbamoyltransferase complex ATPase subunit type 1 TsaE [Streptococcus suis]
MLDMYSQNEQELQAIGRKLGELLRAGDVLVLSGQLGAGKTTLTKGIALGLNIEQMIKSPTYTIVREYEGRLPLYHLDVYRIGDDPDSIDLDDFLYGDGVTVIEWGELLDADLLDDVLTVRIAIEKDGRRLEFNASGPRSAQLKELLDGC